jgi:hypothetical protein
VGGVGRQASVAKLARALRAVKGMDLLSLGKEELGRRELFDRLHESLTVGAIP